MWKKGECGNPGGRRKDAFGELVREKKGLPEELFKTMYALSKCDDKDMQFKATAFLKESGWGKAVQPSQNVDEEGNVVPYSLTVKIDDAKKL